MERRHLAVPESRCHSGSLQPAVRHIHRARRRRQIERQALAEPERGHVLCHARLIDMAVGELGEHRVDRIAERIGHCRAPPVALGAVDQIGRHQTAHAPAVADRGRALHPRVQQSRRGDDLEDRCCRRVRVGQDARAIALPRLVTNIGQHFAGLRVDRDQSAGRHVIAAEQAANVRLKIMVDGQDRARAVAPRDHPTVGSGLGVRDVDVRKWGRNHSRDVRRRSVSRRRASRQSQRRSEDQSEARQPPQPGVRNYIAHAPTLGNPLVAVNKPISPL